MSNKLYEPCPICRSIRPDSPTCRGCAGRGFIQIGLTANQAERLAKKAEALDRVARLVKPLDLASRSPREDFRVRESIVAILAILEDAAGPLARCRRAPDDPEPLLTAWGEVRRDEGEAGKP